MRIQPRSPRTLEIEEAWREGCGYEILAKHYQMSRTRVQRIIKRISTKEERLARVPAPVSPERINRMLIRYKTSEEDAKDIAKVFDMSERNLYRYVRKYNIKRLNWKANASNETA
jgi:Mor family transcriptional regulator